MKKTTTTTYGGSQFVFGKATKQICLNNYICTADLSDLLVGFPCVRAAFIGGSLHY